MEKNKNKWNKNMRGIVEIVWEAIEKIDLEGMQEDIDEEAMVVMAK